jgi:hypothetical protein
LTCIQGIEKRKKYTFLPVWHISHTKVEKLMGNFFFIYYVAYPTDNNIGEVLSSSHYLTIFQSSFVM